jgi:hypothetical protein
MRSDSNAITKRLHSDCAAITQFLQRDCIAIYCNCVEVFDRSRYDYNVISQLLSSDYEAVAKRLCSSSAAIAQRFKAIAERFKAIRAAIAQRLRSDCAGKRFISIVSITPPTSLNTIEIQSISSIYITRGKTMKLYL